MDLTQLAVDAGQFINRAVQFTEETLGQADRTELDPVLEELLVQADVTKSWTDRLMSQMEVLLQPNPGARLEDRLYGHLDWSVPPRPRSLESLGDQMIQAGLQMGSNTPPYGVSLVRCGRTQKLLSEAEKKFVQSINIHFLTPLKRFTEVEYKVIQDQRRMLLNKRLDLDIAISRLRKAREADREARNLNSNPLEDDYLSHVSYMFSFLRVKWLKMWAQEISQAEVELKICQNLFDRQSAITRQAVEGIGDTHMNHMRSLSDFVESQASYYDQCNRHAQELQNQLTSIPAVLCSNIWQSAVSSEPHQPITSNYAANKSDGLNPVSPAPADVRQVNQDSETTTDLSVSTQSHYQINNNNNNNSFTDNQTIGHCSSDPDQISALITMAGLPDGATSLSTTASRTSDQSLTIGDTNDAAAETISTNNTAAETTSTNDAAAETTSANDAAAETTSANDAAAETTSANDAAAETTSANDAATETTSANETREL